MEMSLNGNDLNLASLGTATGTTVDSPAKHIMACKMDTNYLITLLKFAATQNTDALTLLHDNKMRWCMHKHELVLFTGKKLCPGSSFTSSNPKAYPLVITTVGDMHQYTARTSRDGVIKVTKLPKFQLLLYRWYRIQRPKSCLFGEKVFLFLSPHHLPIVSPSS